MHKLSGSFRTLPGAIKGTYIACIKHCVHMQLARQMALLPIDSRLKPSYLARAGGLDEVPSTIEDNPVLAHLLPPNRRPAPRDF